MDHHSEENHHLSALHIENQSEGEDGLSLMDSSTSSNDNNKTSTYPQHLQPLHSSSPPPQQQPVTTSTQQSASKSTNLPLLTTCYMSALTTGATTYAFSFYSVALKSSLNLSQNQLDTLSSATFCAGIMSWIPGMIVDHYGARFAMALGGISNTIMLTLYWIIATQQIQMPNIDLLVLTLSLFGVVIFMGCALVTGSVFKIIVESCGSGTKGKAVGCAKGYVGIGSGVYVCIFSALFGISSGGAPPPEERRVLSFITEAINLPINALSMMTTPDTQQRPDLTSLNFLLMAAIFSFIAAVLPSLLLLPKQTLAKDEYTSKRDGTRSIHFRVVYAGLMLLGLWVVGMSIVELYEEESNNNTNSTSTAIEPSIINTTLFDESIITEYNGFSSTGNEISNSTSYARRLFHITRRLSSSSSQTHWGSVFLLISLWWGPALSLLVIPARKENKNVEVSAFSYDDVNDNESFNISSDDRDEEGEGFLQDGENTKNGGESDPSTKRNYTLPQMLKTCSAWLMAWTCVIIVGGGTVMTNNIGQMVESLSFDPAATSSSLALFSAAQGASRVCTGIASELALNWEVPWCFACILRRTKGVPRPFFLVLASLVSALSHFVLAISTSEVVFTIGVTLCGVAFGMVWPMMVLITGEVFGTRHVGANYMFFDGFSSAAGTLLLSKFVAQEIYDEHITKHHGDDTGTAESSFQCLGANCFAMSHMIVSLLSLTCVVSSLFLIRSTRDVYAQRI